MSYRLMTGAQAMADTGRNDGGDVRAEPIRPVRAADLPALKAVIEANDLFPPDMLDDMAAGYLAGDGAEGIWLTLDGDAPPAVVWCTPEEMTQGTWNLLLIAIHPARHGQGLGTALVGHVEAELAARGGRLLIIETSGLAAFARTRAFYRRLGYEEEARIRDFYRAGEDKIVFRKALGEVRTAA